MPATRADQLKPGHVLVDPSGHLYEIVHVKHVASSVYAWLWPDSMPWPSHFQCFDADEEINFINQKAGDSE